MAGKRLPYTRCVAQCRRAKAGRNLHVYESVTETRQQLTSHFIFYNTRRRQSLSGMAPNTVFFRRLVTKSAA
jgi:hypothetical protein